VDGQRDPDEHGEAITRLFEAGGAEVYVHAGTDDQTRALDFYRHEGLPRLRR
jgi:hypothetical protein